MIQYLDPSTIDFMAAISDHLGYIVVAAIIAPLAITIAAKLIGAIGGAR